MPVSLLVVVEVAELLLAGPVEVVVEKRSWVFVELVKVVVGGLKEELGLGPGSSRVGSDREAAYRALFHSRHLGRAGPRKYRQVGVARVDCRHPMADQASCVSEAWLSIVDP